MTWRRIAPWVIGVIALVAIFIDLPRTTLGLGWLPDEVAGAEFRTVLGLDLQGGIRVTLEAEPAEREAVTADRPRDGPQHHRAPRRRHRRHRAAGAHRDRRRRVAAHRRRGAGRRRPDQVRDLVGSTGQLQFIDPAGPAAAPRARTSATCSRRDGRACSSTAARSTPASVAPAVDGQPHRRPVQPQRRGERHLVPVHDGERRPARADRPRRRGHHDPDHQRRRSAAARRSSPSGPQTRRTRPSARTSTTRCASARCRSR